MKDLKEQIKEKQERIQPPTMTSDKESTEAVKQAIKDDQALSPVASDISVTVKDGAITLDGEVSTAQQSNLASNTAKAIGDVDRVKNRIEVTNK